MRANHLRDIEAIRRLCRDRIQHDFDGEWFDNTPGAVAMELAWAGDPPSARLAPYELVCGLDLLDPRHRFVQIRHLHGGLGGYYVRLRWDGLGWRIDGSWGHGCLLSEEERAFLRRLVRIG
jgi:hypothetical protein